MGLQIAGIVVGVLLGAASAAYVFWTFVLEKDLRRDLRVARARIEDDMMLYPRCRTAAEENGLEVVTPWKEYFTRDSKPFRRNVDGPSERA